MKFLNCPIAKNSSNLRLFLIKKSPVQDFITMNLEATLCNVALGYKIYCTFIKTYIVLSCCLTGNCPFSITNFSMKLTRVAIF